MNLRLRRKNQKHPLTKTRSNLSRSMAGSLLFHLGSCAMNGITLKEFKDPMEHNRKMVLDVSQELQWDTHRGEIIRDSVNVVAAVADFLNANDHYHALIKVYYSNEIRKHIESANLMAHSFNDALLKAGVDQSRTAYEVDHDKNNTYVFYEKNQKVKIFLNR